MRQVSMIAVAVVPVVLWGTACDRDPLRGGAGESCRARDDCESGLACIQQVCTGMTDAGVETVGRGVEEDTKGGVGESCTARRDCLGGLRCIGRICQASVDEEERTVPIQAAPGEFSNRGESCDARNDCAEGLSCIDTVCREDSHGIARSAKSCDRVECEQSEDCCADFIPHPDCTTFEANCAMDPIFCNTFTNLCMCARECRENLCVGAAPGCESDDECVSAQTPYCVDRACRQCREDDNCGEGLKCIQGLCEAPCVRDEQCPLLYSCDDGECVETGCKSKRECYFVTRDGRVDCIDGDCVVPCMRDADCTSGSFQICDRGQCLFVGCETDAECRAALDLQSTNQRVTARCRE
ncbi:MAG: hypothetical protein OXU20_04940 [Myxococcales bacterium]|nr:hypothetical protein [Myxococcales bacterium]